MHDADDPDMAVTAPVLHGPGLTALVVARPANRIPRLPLAKLPQPTKRTSGAPATRKRCRDFDAPAGCNVVGCEMAHVAKSVCRDFNSVRGCTRVSCKHLHEASMSSTKTCKYQMTKAGCRQGAACVNRHIAPQKRVGLPPKDFCDLRSSRQFEYAPTRDNMKIEHDACSSTGAA